MPVDYYVGRTVEELAVLLRAAQDRKAKGNMIEAAAAGVRTVRSFDKNQAVELEILDLRYSLYLRAKGTDAEAQYPNPLKERITRTRVRYVGGEGLW